MVDELHYEYPGERGPEHWALLYNRGHWHLALRRTRVTACHFSDNTGRLHQLEACDGRFLTIRNDPDLCAECCDRAPAEAVAAVRLYRLGRV